MISDHSTQNQSPVANEDVYIGKENTVINGNVLENDYDPDGDPLVVNTELIIMPSVGAVQLGQEGNLHILLLKAIQGKSILPMKFVTILILLHVIQLLLF